MIAIIININVNINANSFPPAELIGDVPHHSVFWLAVQVSPALNSTLVIKKVKHLEMIYQLSVLTPDSYWLLKSSDNFNYRVWDLVLVSDSLAEIVEILFGPENLIRLAGWLLPSILALHSRNLIISFLSVTSILPLETFLCKLKSWENCFIGHYNNDYLL